MQKGVQLMCSLDNLQKLLQYSGVRLPASSNYSTWVPQLQAPAVCGSQQQPAVQQTAPTPQTPLDLFKLANPKLFTLPCFAFPLEAWIKAMAYAAPSSPFCLLTNANAYPCGPAWHAVPFVSGGNCKER